jgi:hypothetical protein
LAKTLSIMRAPRTGKHIGVHARGPLNYCNRGRGCSAPTPPENVDPTAAARAQQSERIKQTYERGNLRKQRSERLKKNWADADFREKMMRARGRAGEQPKERAA